MSNLAPMIDRVMRNGRIRHRMDDLSATNLGVRRQVANPMPDMSGGFRIRDIGLCKDNKKLCEFLACTAANLANSEDFSNLNLAAKVLTDPKLRSDVASDPSIMNMVCQTLKVDKKGCEMVKSGFQMIDKFFTMIEQNQAVVEKRRMEALKRNMGRGGAHNLNIRGKRSDDDDLSDYYGGLESKPTQGSHSQEEEYRESQEAEDKDDEDEYYAMYKEVTESPKKDCSYVFAKKED